MSLIHDALKESGSVATPSRSAARGSWWARQPAATRRLLPVAAIALVAIPMLLLSGVRALRGDAAPTTVVAAAQPITAAEPALPVAPASHTDAVSASGLEQPEHSTESSPPPPIAISRVEEPALVAVQPSPAPQDGEGAPIGKEPAHAAPPAAHTTLPALAEASPQPISIKVERHGGDARAASKAGDATDDAAVERAVAGMEAALAAGDPPAAHQAMARLEALLPAESLTLLRMQAWLAHADGEGAAAERLYRKIAERVPGDINAGVNIALLEARRGELDDARQRLTQLSGRHPRSPQVARALAELETVQP